MWESASSRWASSLAGSRHSTATAGSISQKHFRGAGHACTDQHILGWLSIFCSGAVIPSSVIFYRIAPLCLH
jgi:hypothetical protein